MQVIVVHLTMILNNFFLVTITLSRSRYAQSGALLN